MTEMRFSQIDLRFLSVSAWAVIIIADSGFRQAYSVGKRIDYVTIDLRFSIKDMERMVEFLQFIV